MSQAQWRMKIFSFFNPLPSLSIPGRVKKCFLLLRLCFILSFCQGNRVFRRSLDFFFLYGVITDVSCISIFIRLLLRISVKRNFYWHFIVHFSLPYYVWCGPATLNQECSKCKKIKQLKGYIYTLVKRAKFDGLQHTRVSTKVSRANRSQVRRTSLTVKETPAHAW